MDMDKKRNPYIRVPLVIAAGVMLYFMPTREFLKLTFLLGIPFIFIMGFMVKKPRYSLGWNVCVAGLLVLLGVYGYYLIHLPERIQVREIITSGATLVANGQYDEAIAKFERLESLGKAEQMKEKIMEAQTEKDAHQQLEKARQQIEVGNKEEAQKIIEELPPKTRAAQEAKQLLKTID